LRSGCDYNRAERASVISPVGWKPAPDFEASTGAIESESAGGSMRMIRKTTEVGLVIDGAIPSAASADFG